MTQMSNTPQNMSAHGVPKVEQERGQHLIHNRYENDSPIERERRALVNPDTYRQCLRKFMPGHEGHTDGVTVKCHLSPPCPRNDHMHLAAQSMECFDEPLPTGAEPGSDGAGVTCIRMDGDHIAHGYARVGMGCIPQNVSEPITPAEQRTGVSDVQHAIADEVAALRASIRCWNLLLPGGLEGEWTAHLNRIAALVPQRATDGEGWGIWLHACGHPQSARRGDGICDGCGTYSPDGEAWRALYTVAGR